MTARRRNHLPPNAQPDRPKNVLDPSEHPLGMSDSRAATDRRRDVPGDDHMRLPFEHDETADKQERAGDTDPLIEKAAEDVESGKVDTERRGDAVANFNRRTRRR